MEPSRSERALSRCLPEVPPRARFARALCVGLLVPLAALSACNLLFGIDEQGLRPLDSEDASADVHSPGLSSVRCEADSDCVAPNGCYTPRCDTATKTCLYDLCPVSDKACSRRSCNPLTKTCEGEVTHGFRATTFPTPTILPLGCADLADCVVAVWPFMLIGTFDGVVATLIDDPIATTARTITVEGVSGRVARILLTQSDRGRRAWLLAPLVGDGGPSPHGVKLSVIDVPGDPTATKLTARSVSFQWPYQDLNLYDAGGGRVYLAAGLPALGFPTLILDDLPPDGAVIEPAIEGDAGAPSALTAYRAKAAPNGGVLVESTGTRLVASRGGFINFDVVSDPGTPNATLSLPIATSPPAATNAPAFAVDRTTGSMFTSHTINIAPPPDCGCTSAVRLRALFPNAGTLTIDEQRTTEIERYTVPSATTSPCQACTYVSTVSRLAAIDSSSLLLATAPAEANVQKRVSVRLIDVATLRTTKRSIFPAGETPGGDLATDRAALVTDQKKGFLLLSNSSRSSITIYDPACDVGEGG